MWGLFALLATAAQPTDAPAAAAAQPIPQSYLDCAESYREQLQQSDGARFACTRALLDSLPGNGGTTAEMNDARITAIDVASRYVEQQLAPEIERRLTDAMAADGNPDRARTATISDVVREGNRYAASSCGIVYDVLISGTIRGIAAGNCQVRHMDDLIENLFRIAFEAEPGG